MITTERREYCKRLLDILPQVPVVVAATVLGVSRNTFTESFVDTGLISAVIVPGRKRKLILSADVKSVDLKLRSTFKVQPKNETDKKSSKSILDNWGPISEKIYKEIGWMQ
jgi:hypothetical protein